MGCIRWLGILPRRPVAPASLGTRNGFAA